MPVTLEPIKLLALHSFRLERSAKMIYFKGVLMGFGTVLLGCLVAPIGLMIWAHWNSQGGGTAVSFSPIGLVYHLAHSVGFWIFIVMLFTAGFVPSVFLPKR